MIYTCFSPKTIEKIQHIYTQAMSRDTGISQKLDIWLSYFGRIILCECMSNLHYSQLWISVIKKNCK